MSPILARLDSAARRFSDSWWAPAAVFLASGLIFGYRIGTVGYLMNDPPMQATAAASYARGLLGPDNWWTTPLKHLMLLGDIRIFGNDPVGWRVRNVLLAAALVMMVFLVTRKMFRNHRVVLSATLLTALDPAIINWSRGTAEDSIAVLFVLVAVWFWLRAREADMQRYWLATALFVGLAVATRWSAAAAAAVLVLLALAENRRSLTRIVVLIGYFTLVPLTIYVLAYLPWMSRGYGLPDLALLQVDAVRVQDMNPYLSKGEILEFSQTSTWLYRFDGAMRTEASGNGRVSRQTLLNNPFVWSLLVPASFFLVYWSWRQRRPDWFFIGVQSPLLYGIFLLMSRPVPLYVMPILLPFGFMSISFAAARLFKSRAWIPIGVLVLSDVLLLPVVLGIPMPPAVYDWLAGALAANNGGLR